MNEQLASMRSAFLDDLQEEYPVHLDIDALRDEASDTAVVLRVAGETATKREIIQLVSERGRKPGDQEQLEPFLRSMATDAQLYNKANALGLAEEVTVKERYRVGVGVALVESILTTSIDTFEVSEETLKKHFEAHRGRFSKQKTWHVHEILVAGTGDERMRAWQHANEILKHVRAGDSFADLARENSAAVSAQNGGDLGWLMLHETARRGPEFQRCLFSLEEGGISDVVRIDQGYLILKLEQVSEPEEREYGEVKEAVRDNYLERNRMIFIDDMKDQHLRDIGFRYLGEAE
jgi:hypothetical protein